MTENSDPLENSVAEQTNKMIKEEFRAENQISFGSLITKITRKKMTIISCD